MTEEIPNYQLDTPDSPGISISAESASWRSRGVVYLTGKWAQIQKQIPRFELGDFVNDPESPPNPFYRTVFRLPMTPMERRMPVGIVSNSYTLAQHQDVARLCMEGLQGCGIDPASLDCELGLSTLGEWMNFRAILPAEFDHLPKDQRRLKLRIECFNSVDGSACLELFLGWFRLICTNGLIIGESLRQLKEIHNAHLDIEVIRDLVREVMETVVRDKKKLTRWTETPVQEEKLVPWVDGVLSDTWGKLAAFRVLHVCRSAQDAEFADPFEKERPSKKQVKLLDVVPGAAKPARNLYDVSQALSWVATTRRNADQRSDWQRGIPGLIDQLAV